MAYFVHAWLWKHSRTLKIDWHVVNLNHVKLVNTSMVTNISRMTKPQHDSVVTSVWQLSVFVEGFPIKAVKLVFVKRHRATDGLNSAVCETYTLHLRSKTPLDPGGTRPAVHVLRFKELLHTKSSALTHPCIVLNRMTASLQWNQKLCFWRIS